MIKNYVILGSNNFWYSYFETGDFDDIHDELQLVKEQIRNNETAAGTEKPENLRVFEVTLIQTVEQSEI